MDICALWSTKGSEMVAKELEPSAHATPLTGPRWEKTLMHSPVSASQRRADLHMFI